VVLRSPPALAVPTSIQIPAEDAFDTGQGGSSAGPFGFLNGISRSGYMFGDMWGLRSALAKYGISFALQETSEVLGNVSGGTQRGAAYDGLTQMALQLDTARAFGLYGGTFKDMSKFDMLNRFTTHTGGGLFACPGGVREGSFIGASLFEKT
jgi:porin